MRVVLVTLALIFCTALSAGASDEVAVEAPAPVKIPVVAQTPKYGMSLAESWIFMPDGIRLAVDLYMPTGADEGERFPVLLEYLPYRKTDSRARNWDLNHYFVERGYVVARVDIRGTGNSEGRTIPYEYSDIELDDGEVVIDWLAKQHWSNGAVGMFGISWGGFNAIQMAIRKPPAYKAFVALMATEALYQEDVHYMDGIMHTDSWMMSHDLYNALPGAPEFRTDAAWAENRFDVKPSVYAYMRQQRDGPFWDRASALNEYDQIEVPGFHIGGWYDGYRNSLPRMLENVNAPVKAMIGPWDHYFPHNAWPAPQVEWRHEAVRWFDHWLKGKDSGIVEEPQFAVYVRDWHPPGPNVDHIPGRWRWEDGWPLARSQSQRWFMSADQGLARTPGATAVHRLDYRASAGLEGGGPVMWWGSIAPDQQPMDDQSLVYDSDPLEAPVEILGRPLARLRVAADATRANWVVRISDVSPDGQVTQVSGAGFNGTHRESARQPKDLVPGERFTLDINLNFTSWVFPKGHRIRVAISNGQWPMFWPTPYPLNSELQIGGTEGASIQLPVIPDGGNGDEPESLGDKQGGDIGDIRDIGVTGGSKNRPNLQTPQPPRQLTGYETLDSGNVSGYAEIRQIERDPQTGESFGIASNSGGQRYPWGVERFEERIEHRTSDTNPAFTSVTGSYALTEELEDRTLRLEQDVEFSSDLENFRLRFVRRLLIDGELVREKDWDELIPRDFQ